VEIGTVLIARGHVGEPDRKLRGIKLLTKQECKNYRLATATHELPRYLVLAVAWPVAWPVA
jgi:hypothetical protein